MTAYTSARSKEREAFSYSLSCCTLFIVVDDRIQTHARASHPDSAKLSSRQRHGHGGFYFGHCSSIISYESNDMRTNLACGLEYLCQ